MSNTKDIELHVAGATVRHKNPFIHLLVPPQTDLSVEDIKKWVLPLYMANMASPDFFDHFLDIRKDVSEEIIFRLLGEFNWRPRLVAARFAAIENLKQTEESIGHLLLRSDVCYAGSEYCLTLAAFNTTTSREYLREYLDYYLKQHDLYFDQGAAMGAIAFLDEVNGTQVVAELMSEWKDFVRNKPHWCHEKCVQSFRDRMNILHTLQQKIGN